MDDNSYWAMVRSHDIRMDGSILDARSELSGIEEIVDPPAGIIEPSTSQGRPPGIGSLQSGIALAEYVDESDIQESVESMALLQGKSMLPFVLFRMFEIDRLMGDIEISTQDDRFMRLKFCDKIPHRLIPYLPIGQTREVFLGIGDIGRDVVEILELEGERSSLVIRFRSDAVHNREGWDFGQDGGAGISGTVRAIEDTAIPE